MSKQPGIFLIIGDSDYTDAGVVVSQLNSIMESLCKLCEVRVLVGDCPTGVEFITRMWLKTQTAVFFKKLTSTTPTSLRETLENERPDFMLAIGRGVDTEECVRIATKAGVEVFSYDKITH